MSSSSPIRRDNSVRVLIDALDSYMLPLYPAESNHLLDVETLRQPRMRFFAAFRETEAGEEALGIGGCWLHDEYAEIKRVYVSPAARGLGLAKRLMERIEDEARLSGRPAGQARDRHPPARGDRPLPGAGLCRPRTVRRLSAR